MIKTALPRPFHSRTLKALSILMISTALCTSGAQAQSAQANQRMERLERDLQIIQRQLSRGEVTPDASGGGTGDAQLEVRISTIEDELRNLRGKTEENDFQVRRLNENMEKMQRDIEMRFNDLHKQPAAAAPATPATTEGTASDAGQSMDSTEPASTDAASSEAKSNAGDFSTPREYYNYAFRLLNQTKYKEAADAFAEFTQKYPKDPLVGNAFYWQGETHYIRRDYVKSADMFRQGFEALPDGPKAADNLLKLAMSLSALKRDKEACVVLEQLATKFMKSSKNIATRATQEQKRIACKGQ
jgi:tol-pal system protein YbgF